jgi:hypothetical protein
VPLLASQINLTTSTGPTISVTGYLGPDGQLFSDGYGGWTTIARPRATAVTFWGGAAPFTMKLQIVLDDFIAGTSIEDQIFKLERMSLPADRNSTPPLVDIDGAALTRTNIRWCLDDIQWDDVERNEFGKRIRQVATLTMIQYVADTKLKASRRATKKVKAGSAQDKHNQFLGR